jgi:hypothetical protein
MTFILGFYRESSICLTMKKKGGERFKPKPQIWPLTGFGLSGPSAGNPSETCQIQQNRAGQGRFERPAVRKKSLDPKSPQTRRIRSLNIASGHSQILLRLFSKAALPELQLLETGPDIEHRQRPGHCGGSVGESVAVRVRRRTLAVNVNYFGRLSPGLWFAECHLRKVIASRVPFLAPQRRRCGTLMRPRSECEDGVLMRVRLPIYSFCSGCRTCPPPRSMLPS